MAKQTDTLSKTRRRESVGEIGGGAVLTVLGIIWAAVSNDYGVVGDGGRLAPGTLPFVCGVGLALTGAMIAIKAAVKGNGAGGTPVPDVADATDVPVEASGTVRPREAPAGTLTVTQRVLAAPRLYPIATVYGLVVLTVMVMPILGFAIAFACGIFGILRLVERQSIRTSALVAIITALLGYALFELIFNLPLPEPFFL